MLSKILSRFVLVVVFSLTLTPLAVMAEEVGEHHGEEPHRHRHHLALFVGGIHADTETEHEGHESETHEESVDAFSVGVDYEYRLNTIFGIGGFVEYAGGDLETIVSAPALFIHPVGGLKFIFAPGVEHTGDHNVFLFRTGVYYDFFFDNFSVGPTLSVDFVDGEKILIYGVSLGYGF